MNYPSSPDDRPDPMDVAPPMRARVPEHVAGGQISTGVIVVTGATEYILDFVRNLPRPNLIVARVILPHAVMPQFIEALNTNINLYRQRFADLTPNLFIPSTSPPITSDIHGVQSRPAQNPLQSTTDVFPGMPTPYNPDQPGAPYPNSNRAEGSGSGEYPNEPSSEGLDSESADAEQSGAKNHPHEANHPQVNRFPSPQEVYDELKLKDELLSGTYANAVMIGHGPHEFSFDFITNFYPQSAVSCRVFMASGHVGRLLDSLRASWEQLKPRLGGGGPSLGGN